MKYNFIVEFHPFKSIAFQRSDVICQQASQYALSFCSYGSFNRLKSPYKNNFSTPLIERNKLQTTTLSPS